MEFAKRKHRVHFVGIGGIGMSGIAEVLLNLGFPVTGSDLAASDTTERLAANGARIALGHHADRVDPDVEVVVISSAVKFSNPEVVRARELGIPVIPRAEMLAELMHMKYGLAVAGTHGKTTTTSLLGHVLAEAGLDPTLVIGGKVRALGTNARVGEGRTLVAEADESDGSFLLLTPTLAIVTNIDPEHLDHYGTMEHVHAAYLQFINRVPFYGLAVLCIDSVAVRALLPQVRKRFVTYGLDADADVQGVHVEVSREGTRFDVLERGRWLGHVRLRLPGHHNAQNALAVVAASRELGLTFEATMRALASFEGIHRRFEVKGEVGGVTVVDDYGHHPQEIKATLRAARQAYGGRVIAIFQPHRYTRTRDLFDSFLEAFDDADLLILTEVYAAGEDPLEGIGGEALADALKRRGHVDVRFVAAPEAIVEAVRPALRGGDIVVTLGAGNLHRICEPLLEALAREKPVVLQ